VTISVYANLRPAVIVCLGERSISPAGSELTTLSNIHAADPVSAPKPAAAGAPAIGTLAKATQAGIRNRTVLLYLSLAMLALVPGLALRAGLSPADLTAAGLTSYLTALQQELQDIRFGSGLRFWLGVGGTAMLALLLLYPVRKVLANRRGVGSVSGWFHAHILLGIIGPLLILYHSNFGHGSLNANVALWTMLLVAVSGIIGFFVYGRISANFYNSRQQAQTHRNAVLASIPDTALFQARKDQLIGKFEAFEAELLTPRQGLMSSVRARLRLERRRREIADDVGALVVETARSRGDAPPAFQQFRGLVGRHVRAYFGIARAAASQSILEQLWSRWRLLHMPVFLIMIVAALLHVVAVWDFGEPTMAEADQAGIEVAADTPAVRQPVKTETLAAGAAVTTAQEQDAPRPSMPPGMSLRVVKPILTPRVVDATPKPSVAAPTPQLARRPVSARPVQTNDAFDAKASEAKAAEPQLAETKLAETKATMEPRRIEAPPMALGGTPFGIQGGRQNTLDEQFAAFKAKQQAGTFSHSDIETGFGLTGKHLKIECASCHNAPLPVTRQNTAARTCLSCHEKDDNHSGRRPDCAKCHTTNRWKQRIR
jgi:hypothetical protein